MADDDDYDVVEGVRDGGGGYLGKRELGVHT